MNDWPAQLARYADCIGVFGVPDECHVHQMKILFCGTCPQSAECCTFLAQTHWMLSGIKRLAKMTLIIYVPKQLTAPRKWNTIEPTQMV